MVVAIFCGHPDNLEDSDESERGTVARLDPKQNRERIAVGLPVTRQPPHRSRRAVFPHRALREYSLPHEDLS